MRHYWTLLLLALVVAGGCQRTEQTNAEMPAPEVAGPETGEGQWLTSLDEGLTRAAQEKKPLIVDFYATWCGPCKMLDEQTWPDAAVKSALGDFIAVKIDVDKHGDLAEKYRIQSIPVIVFMDSSGQEVHRRVGFVAAEEMAGLMETHK